MGCSCDNNIEVITNNQNNVWQKKSVFQNEYFSYLNFIFKLKENLNVSICADNNIDVNNEEDKYENEKGKRQEFYLIPAIWFENWEKWIKNIIMRNVYESFNTKFKYKNYKNNE